MGHARIDRVEMQITIHVPFSGSTTFPLDVDITDQDDWFTVAVRRKLHETLEARVQRLAAGPEIPIGPGSTAG